MNAKAVLELIENLAVLKNLPRTGWALRGITNCESIADHCFRMSFLSMLLADVLIEQGVPLDAAKVMRMALLHEIGEARLGDIPVPAMRYLPADAKAIAEQAAIEAMLCEFGPLSEKYRMLWLEFEEASTLEGKLVRAVDKLEMMIQVYEYEKIGYRCVDDFWLNPNIRRDFVVNPLVQDIMALLEERRQVVRGKG